MTSPNSAGVQHCPECGQLLQTLWDYPSNEVWCLRCGNRFYRVLSSLDGADPEAHCRMLILDCDGSRRDALTGRFATLGYHVTPVCHPRQALEAASFRHFDIALLSADWPGFETPGLIAKLRWQLGNVKFIVFDNSESEHLNDELRSDDVICLHTDLSHFDELESTLEQLVHGLEVNGLHSGAQPRDFAHLS